MRVVSILVLLVAAGCGSDGSTPDAAPVRLVDAHAVVAGNGRSAPVMFEVPPGTRSIAITITGQPAALYALAELVLADQADLVQLSPDAPGPAMQASYRDEQIGQMPGALYQSIRLGQFTHVHPNRPDQLVPPGPASLRVASDTSSEVAVRIVMVADDGGVELAINVITVSDTLDVDEATVVADAAALFAPAGISASLGRSITITGSALASITDFNEPQETPTSQSAQLPALAAAQLAGADGVDVFVVDSLPTGIAGLSLGTPGPPERGGYYFGVVIEAAPTGAVSGRVVAHEVSHFLGLQHVQNTGISGATYPDPLDDTQLGVPNLMQSGTALTADQGWVLRHSPIMK